RKLMAEQNVTITNETEAMMEELEQDGKTAMLISVANKLAGIIAVADTVKETSKEAISRMHQLGLEVIMLTGDNERTEDAIAKQKEINRVNAEVLPDQKIDEIKNIQSHSKIEEMVGYGIN